MSEQTSLLWHNKQPMNPSGKSVVSSRFPSFAFDSDSSNQKFLFCVPYSRWNWLISDSFRWHAMRSKRVDGKRWNVNIKPHDVIDYKIDRIQCKTTNNTCIYRYRIHAMWAHIGSDCHRLRCAMQSHTNMRQNAQGMPISSCRTGPAIL